MRPYEPPALRDLGRMTAVTRKSGPDFDFIDIQTAAADNTDPGAKPPGWPDWLCWPPGVPTLFCP